MCIRDRVAGVRTNAKVSVLVDGDCQAADTGELQLTNYGISGIPVFQISRFAAKALKEKKLVEAEIDFFPEADDNEFCILMEERKRQHADRTAEDFFVGIFNRKLSELFLKQAYIPCLLYTSRCV